MFRTKKERCIRLMSYRLESVDRWKGSLRKLRPTSNGVNTGVRGRGREVGVQQKVTGRIRTGRVGKGKGDRRKEGGKNSPAEKTESINLRSYLQPPAPCT